jgi:hypothetical protein
VKHLLRDPVTVFFALGLALFLTYQLLNDVEETPITLSPAGLAVLVSELEMLTGRSATNADVQRLEAEFYERELLFQEALKAELYRVDPNLREQLIDLMRKRITGVLPQPGGQELVNYYTDHIERYYSEATLSLEQRFFAQRPANADAILAALNRGEEVNDVAPPQGRLFPDYGLSMLRGLFGQSLFANIAALTADRWEGPFESTDGWHYFRVTGRRDPTLLPFAKVSDQVAADLQSETIARRVRAFVDARRQRYPFKNPE